MKKKALILVLAAVVLVVASIGGTLAYLTQTQTVTNAFTVGKIVMTLDEAPVGEDGKEIAGARVQANDNYKIVPGAEFDKDPTVTIEKGSEESWLFVCVKDGLNGEVDGSAVLEDWNTSLVLVDGYTDLYVYSNASGVATVTPTGADWTLVVFDGVTIDGAEVDMDNIGELDGAEIIVGAFAHQVANADYDDALAAAATALGATSVAP